MKLFSLLLTFGLGTFCIYGQNLTKAEYFIDTDPGIGAGINVPFTAAPTITDLQISVPVTSLSNGLHSVFFRVKDSNGFWSVTERTYFYKLVIPTITETPTPPAVNLVKAEYFIDADPGFGAGNNIPITAGLAITDAAVSVPVTSLTNGLHSIFFRVKDANGFWSTTERTYFYKLVIPTLTQTPTPPAVNITKAEFFIDTDPGFGAGTNIPITAGLAINDAVVQVPVTSLSNGLHQIFFRVKDANGFWSTTERTYFYKLTIPTITETPAPPATNITQAEYFFDTDPGIGAGKPISITPGTTITDLLVPVSVSSLEEGPHKVFLRVKNANGSWSVTESASFSVCNGNVPTSATASAITSTGFTANWASTVGAISYQLDVSADDFVTLVNGYNPKVINAPVTNAEVTGLSQGTLYKYRVRGVGTCASVNSAVISVVVPVATPTAQPTAMTFPARGSNNLSVQFTPPATLPSGYLVVRRAGAYTTFVPTVNTNYTVGLPAGDGEVVHSAATPLFSDTGLSPNTNYFYTVFAYNSLNGYKSYNTAAPLKNSAFTLSAEPAAQATNMTFVNVTSTAYTVQYTTATGNPTGYIVLRKEGSEPASIPVDGFAYTNTVGTDAIAYQGSALTFNETGLTENTTYYYAVYAYNGSGTSINYKTLSPLLGNVTTPLTPPAAPTSLQYTATTSSISASFTAVGAPSGYLVVRKQGAVASTWPPELNTSYSIGPVNDGTIIYIGPNAFFTDTGLTASTQYTYSIFPFRQLGSLISYQTTALQGTKSTFTAEPTAQASSITFSDWTSITLKVNFTAASPAPLGGYLVLRKADSAPTIPPTDGTAYSVGNDIGTGKVVYVGNGIGLPFTDSGLTPGTNYFYQVFSYNGTGANTNYLISNPGANSTITVPGKPAAPSANPVGQTNFTINWSTTTGATSYRLDVSLNNFESKVVDNLTVNGTSAPVNNLLGGTTYQYRIRAVNSSGISEDSEIVSQITVPFTPKYLPATAKGKEEFTANWSAAKGAEEYFLDVSKASNFSPLVIQFTLGNVTTKEITSLEPGTLYYYRLRSKNAGGTSPDSASVSQLMIPPTVSVAGIVPDLVQETNFTAKWNASKSATEYRVEVTLASEDFNTILATYQVTIAALNVSVIGLTANTPYKYRVYAKNATGETPEPSLPISVVTAQPGTTGPKTVSLPFVAGGTLETYRMFSIPLQLDGDITENNIDVMFEGLGKQADDSWKLLRWNSSNKAFDRYPGQLNKIERGKSYWFNSKTQANVSVTGTAYSDASFPMILQPGWNQIGSPYDKNLSWADILATNSTVTNINMVESDLYRYVSSPPGFATTDNLKAWSGNYVFNKSDKQVTLNVRFNTKLATGSRISAKDFERDLSQNNWFVPFTLMVGDREHSNSSIGMHPEAKPGIDEFDGMTVPRFVDYVEMNSPHPEFFEPNFSRDIVATSSNHHWHFIAETNLDSEQALLNWNNVALGTGEAVLILYDPTNGALVNMKEVGQYQFNLKNGKHPLHFIYAKDADNLKPEITSLAQVYPNPAATFVIFPFLTSAEGFVRLEVFDLTGKKVKTLFDRTFPAGLQKVQWDVNDDQGVRVPAGLYIYRFTGSGSQVQTGKLIIK